MASSKLRLRRCFALFAFPVRLLIFNMQPSVGHAQQQLQGFAVERFYPSPPGAGWFVMDDLNIHGGLGGAIEFTSGYASNPLVVAGSGGAPGFRLVRNQAFARVAVAVTYDRYRAYLDIPTPLLVTGDSGVVGPYHLPAPALNFAVNPDTVSDPSLGFDVRLSGQPGSSLRLGAGAQLFFPAGQRSDYVTDGRYRAMFRFLAAGDAGAFSYAGQVGVHVRPLRDPLIPGGPNGSELLFGASAGRKLTAGGGWTVIVGPEICGETAFRSSLYATAGAEALLTARFERTDLMRVPRIKVGVGHGLAQQFGAPEWRALASVEVSGHKR